MLLKFYDYCPSWTAEVDENPDTYEEQNKFEESEHVTKAIQRVNDRLGFTNSVIQPEEIRDVEEKLFFKDLELIYDICRFEAAWYPNNVSYWCSVFDEEDLKVIIVKMLLKCNLS